MRDKLEYQKKLRFLREARAKTASEQLKLAKRAEESDLTKPMVTLGDKENRVPARGETPKAYNETPKTGEESLYKDPVEGGDKKEKNIELDLDLMDVVQLKETKGWYVFKVSEGPNDEPYDGSGLEMLDIEPQYYSDKREAEAVADMLIDAEDEDFDVARVGSMMMEATPPQEDADQSLLRFKKRKKATRTKALKRKSHAKTKIKEALSLDELLRECGCEMESPFDAPEDEPQGYMLKQSLEKIGSQATDLSNLANHDDDPEPWVEFKVTSAAEQIDAVHDYIKYGRKHRSDMSGHEDMHSAHDHQEMMSENSLRNFIRKIVSEQTSPIIDPWSTNPVPSSEIVDPWATTTSPSRRRRRRPITEPLQACNMVFDTNTARSFINHCIRLRRGLTRNEPSIANYELSSHSSHRRMLTNYFNLISTALDELGERGQALKTRFAQIASQIGTLNVPNVADINQITDKRGLTARLTATIELLRTNANICAELQTILQEPPAPEPTPGPAPSPDPNVERSRTMAQRALATAEQALARYIHSIVTGEVDLRNESNRPEYFQRLNGYQQQINNALRTLYGIEATTNREEALASLERRIAMIDSRIGTLDPRNPGFNPMTVATLYENKSNVENLLNFLFEAIPTPPPPIAIPALDAAPSGLSALLNSPVGATGLRGAGLTGLAGLAGYGLGTGLVGTVGALSGRGTDVVDVGGVPIGLAIRPETGSFDDVNLRFASTAATRALQNQKSALQAIANELRTGARTEFANISAPASPARSIVSDEDRYGGAWF